MAIDFRGEARRALARARAELAADDTGRVRYAALELRLAIEGLTYSRAEGYKAEIPPSEYGTWQPRKLMQLLVDIDAGADKSSAISVGLEEEYGKESKDMKVLGKSEVISLATIKQHYDALGSYLHLPSLKQIENGPEQNLNNLRARCEVIAGRLQKVLDSHLFNVNFAVIIDIVCFRCGSKIRKRMPHGKVVIEAKCFSCGAPYTVEDVGGGKVQWTATQEKFRCQNPDCDTELTLWKDEIRDGNRWNCPACQRPYAIGLAIFADPRSS